MLLFFVYHTNSSCYGGQSLLRNQESEEVGRLFGWSGWQSYYGLINARKLDAHAEEERKRERQEWKGNHTSGWCAEHKPASYCLNLLERNQLVSVILIRLLPPKVHLQALVD